MCVAPHCLSVSIMIWALSGALSAVTTGNSWLISCDNAAATIAGADVTVARQVS
jgi:hypothetical protein